KPMEHGQERHAHPAVQLDPPGLDPGRRKKGPEERAGDHRMCEDMDHHAHAALALPRGHLVGLEREVRDEMRQHEPPKNLHYLLFTSKTPSQSSAGACAINASALCT